MHKTQICPFSQRARMALEEAGAQYINYEIDLSHKPEWYITKVNPASKGEINQSERLYII
jgi:glutathione S-transferase